MKEGRVVSLILVPARREVEVSYSDGRNEIVPILPNDQNILRAAEASSTPLTVKDIKKEQAIASLTGNVGLLLIFLIALIAIIRKSTTIANKTLGFGSSQARAQSEDIDIRFEDVAGIAEAKEELEEIITFLRKPEKLIKLGAKIPKGILLIGPPGTGKTLLAKAIAGEAEVPFFSISGSEFVEMFVGVGASRVRDLFIKAKKKTPCIVFIDEIDAIGRQRGAGIGGGNDEREQTLNQLLTEMDGFSDNSGIILLAATNRPDVLDSALMRPGRFDRRISVSLPDRKDRKDILAVHARSKPLEEEVSIIDIAYKTPGFTGADLENLLNESAILAARANKKKIGIKQVESALERITMGSSTSPLQESSKKRLIAYHEIGHALVALFTPLADKIDKVSIIPRSGGLTGYTRFTPDEEILDSSLVSKAYLQAKLVVALGGRASEIVIFGKEEITQGAFGDLAEVYRISKEMITRFGFSKLGLVTGIDSEQDVFIGGGLIRKKNLGFAESTYSSVDQEIRVLAEDSLKKAIEILKPRRNLLDKLVEALVEEETLSSERFLHLVNSQTN